MIDQNQMLQNFITEALSNVDAAIVILLMGIGFLIKHLRVFEKVQNNLIPVVMLASAIIISFLQNGFTVPAIVIAVASAAIANGLHQQGKNIFMILVPQLSNLIGALIPTKAEPVEEEKEEQPEVAEETENTENETTE